MPSGGCRPGAGRKVGGKNRTSEERRRGPCAYCGSQASVRPGSRYCSRSCGAYGRHGNGPPGDRRCAHCGGHLSVKSPRDRIYCSHECALRGRSAKARASLRSCAFCKTGIVKKSRSKFCSRVCLWRSLSARAVPRIPAPRVCACGAVLENKHKTVCERCLDERRRLTYEATKAKRRDANRRRIRPARVCPCCGTSFHPQHDHRLYCSPRCARRIVKAGRYPLLGSLPRGPDRDALAQFIATVKAMRITIDQSTKGALWEKRSY